jgi:hypothetical protein
MEKFKTRRNIIIGAVILIFLFIITVAYMNTRNPYGDELSIANLDSFTKDKPAILNAIKSNLYKVVKMNTHKEIKSNSIKDILIRKDSFSQEYNPKFTLHTVKFIVDIASLKQSYAVSYQWVDDKKYFTNMDEYGSEITCIPIDKLIYGDFKCVDERIIEQGVRQYDPIALILPYTVKYKYTVVSHTKEENGVTLRVDAFVPAWETDKAKVLDEYTTEIKAWIKSKKLDPEKYSLEFIY